MSPVTQLSTQSNLGEKGSDSPTLDLGRRAALHQDETLAAFRNSRELQHDNQAGWE